MIKIKKKVPVVMVGSLLQQDFGESIGNHGFLLWDVENLTFEEVDLNNDYGFYTFSINGVDEIDEDKEKLLNGITE